MTSPCPHDWEDFESSGWICGCGEYNEEVLHCISCGNCPPWGCGEDHDNLDVDDYPEDYEDFDPDEDYYQ